MSTFNTTSTSANAGANLGERGGNVITNAGKAAFGLGEGIRGNINSFLDSVGNGIKNDPQHGTAPTAQDTASTTKNEQVAAHGADQMQSGLQGLKRV